VSNLQQEALRRAELPAGRTSALTQHLSTQAPDNHITDLHIRDICGVMGYK